MQIKRRLMIGAIVLAALLILLLIPPARDSGDELLASQPSETLRADPTSAPSETQTPTQQPMEEATLAPTQTPTEEPTEAPTQAPTQKPTDPPPTKPSVQETEAPPPQGAEGYSDNPLVIAFIEERMASWKCPVKDGFAEVIGSRKFATSRSNGSRAHAGLDFVAPHGTKVYAITSGTVQRVAVFYQSTWAVEVKNDDGSILRYCEIATNLKVGDRVEQNDIIGTIMRADGGTEMLHMEVYYGDGEGKLTQGSNRTYKYVDTSKNFQRRSDLLDPTFLKDLPL